MDFILSRALPEGILRRSSPTTGNRIAFLLRMALCFVSSFSNVLRKYLLYEFCGLISATGALLGIF